MIKMNLLLLIFIMFFLFYKNNSGKIRANFDEIFGNEWTKNKSEEQVIKNEQIDQNEQNENSATVDPMGEEMGTDPNDQQREMIQKFDAIKEKLKEKGKYENEKRNKIEWKIAKLLGTNREKIYKWKKEMNLNKKIIMKRSFYDKKKSEFIERFNEFKSLYAQRKQKEFVKELGISENTFRKWKKELLPNFNITPNKYSNVDKLRKMKQYLEIKGKIPKISEKIIAKKLGISSETLYRWKKEYVF